MDLELGLLGSYTCSSKLYAWKNKLVTLLLLEVNQCGVVFYISVSLQTRH